MNKLKLFKLQFFFLRVFFWLFRIFFKQSTMFTKALSTESSIFRKNNFFLFWNNFKFFNQIRNVNLEFKFFTFSSKKIILNQFSLAEKSPPNANQIKNLTEKKMFKIVKRKSFEFSLFRSGGKIFHLKCYIVETDKKIQFKLFFVCLCCFLFLLFCGGPSTHLNDVYF